ncbi:MAG TPA: hypothetical protein PKW56_06785 [Clostridiales bacterium]|nr:hypothetical protein [Clostridiales bacterium]
MKAKPDEIQALLDGDDLEWIENYKKTISLISEEHSRLEQIKRPEGGNIEAYEDRKENICKMLKESFHEPEEEDNIDFEVYYNLGVHSEYERQLSNLYKLFEQIFPNDELWPFMAEEKRKHECWLKDIMKKMKDGTIIFTIPPYDPQIVVNAVVNVAEIISYCREYRISHK